MYLTIYNGVSSQGAGSGFVAAVSDLIDVGPVSPGFNEDYQSNDSHSPMILNLFARIHSNLKIRKALILFSINKTHFLADISFMQKDWTKAMEVNGKFQKNPHC